jgi:glycosidase
VLVDLVANHLHEEHPLVSEHATDGWFHDYFACGFEEAPLSCWFESYLPDINYQNDAAVEEMVDAALWWIREADLDGFRVDAVKHMHDSLLRTLRARIKAEVETIPDSVFYLVGETFTGDWGGGGGPNESIIKQYISPDLLHGQFDFPLYWRVLRVFARDEAPPSHVAEYLAQNSSYFGSQAVMGTFVGNHDVPRFISHAAGDIADLWGTGSKQQGWDTPPGTPAGSEAYERMALAFSLLFTVEGVPLIYYGDEVGLPGAGDPDNRRPMVFEGWSEAQQSLHAHISALASVRAQQPTLRRGSYETLHTDEAVLAFRREGESGVVIVVLNCSGSARSLSLALAESSSWTDALSGEEFSVVGEQLTVGLPAWSTRILLP